MNENIINLSDFWKYLPGQWKFERVFSNHIVQVGSWSVGVVTDNFYKVHEWGIYKNSAEQTFFRNYNYSWSNGYLNIYGENPKDGYVLLHHLSDASRRHTHFCNRDQYHFELLEMSSKSWSSSVIITGPCKSLKFTTFYQMS